MVRKLVCLTSLTGDSAVSDLSTSISQPVFWGALILRNTNILLHDENVIMAIISLSHRVLMHVIKVQVLKSPAVKKPF